MNRYSLSSDSRRWWWLSATTGAAATASVAAVLLLPGVGQAAPDPVTPAEPALGVLVPQDPPTDRACFMVRPRWNVALDGTQPRCEIYRARARSTRTAAGRVHRPGLDSLF